MAPLSPNLRNLGGQAGDETRPTENLNGVPGGHPLNLALREWIQAYGRGRAQTTTGPGQRRRRLTASTAVLPMD